MTQQAVSMRVASRWRSFEGWVGTRSSAAALFLLALAVFALQSAVLPVHPGRDMGRYVQSYLQLFQAEPILPSVLNERGPLAALGVGVPLELGGGVAEIWLALLYAASILAWAVLAHSFGAKASAFTSAILLVYPGYGMLFHELSSDVLFAAALAGWAVILSRAILGPSIATFLVAGVGMGFLVLIRPGNQVLIVFTVLPLLLRAPWGARIRWTASFFVGSAAVTQGWKTVAAIRYDDSVSYEPSGAVILVAALLLLSFAPAVWRRRLALFAVPVVVVLAVGGGVSVGNPANLARTVAQGPSSDVFLFRAFEMDRIVSPDNGPASRLLARVVQRELLTKEPYRSYGVSEEEFFSSGSDRIFQDLLSLGGQVDLRAVTNEAISRHPRAFASGIASTLWAMMWTRRVYASVGTPDTGDRASAEESEGSAYVVIGGRKLPRPSEGQPIPASRVGRTIRTQGGGAHEVWRSATEHPLVFDDPAGERRWEAFEADTARLTGRLPTRDANAAAVHRLNQASRAFPPPFLWLAVGLAALAVRRPQRALVALVPAAAGLVVIGATALVAVAVAHYAAPVSPAFVVLAACGVVGTRASDAPRSRRQRRLR